MTARALEGAFVRAYHAVAAAEAAEAAAHRRLRELERATAAAGARLDEVREALLGHDRAASDPERDRLFRLIERAKR